MDLQKEREAFEAVTSTYHCIYNADLNYYFSGSKFVGNKAEIEVNAGWKAWQAAKAQAAPEGFVLMPKEPTKEIVEAFWNSWLVEQPNAQTMFFAYKAMIKAQGQGQ